MFYIIIFICSIDHCTSGTQDCNQNCDIYFNYQASNVYFDVTDAFFKKFECEYVNENDPYDWSYICKKGGYEGCDSILFEKENGVIIDYSENFQFWNYDHMSKCLSDEAIYDLEIDNFFFCWIEIEALALGRHKEKGNPRSALHASRHRVTHTNGDLARKAVSKMMNSAGVP